MEADGQGEFYRTQRFLIGLRPIITDFSNTFAHADTNALDLNAKAFSI